MTKRPTGEAKAPLRPIHSLLSKSEKALAKLNPGTWQHDMLQDNIQALRLAASLLGGQPTRAGDDLPSARRTLAGIITKTRKAQAKFQPGTSHHTLQRNRLHALQAAQALIRTRLKTSTP